MNSPFPTTSSVNTTAGSRSRRFRRVCTAPDVLALAVHVSRLQDDPDAATSRPNARSVRTSALAGCEDKVPSDARFEVISHWPLPVSLVSNVSAHWSTSLQNFSTSVRLAGTERTWYFWRHRSWPALKAACLELLQPCVSLRTNASMNLPQKKKLRWDHAWRNLVHTYVDSKRFESASTDWAYLLYSDCCPQLLSSGALRLDGFWIVPNNVGWISAFFLGGLPGLSAISIQLQRQGESPSSMHEHGMQSAMERRLDQRWVHDMVIDD